MPTLLFRMNACAAPWCDAREALDGDRVTIQHTSTMRLSEGLKAVREKRGEV